MNLHKRIDLFIENQFPDFFKTEGEKLVKFMELYYKWLSEEGNPVYVSRSLPEYNDIDLTPEQFIPFMKEEFLHFIPDNTAEDIRFILKKILNFYKSKGTEDSYRFLFRIIYGEEIDFYYPYKDILRLSDGKWYKEQYINIFVFNRNIINSNNIGFIRGANSRALARYDVFSEYIENGVPIQKIVISNVRGNYQFGENLIDENSGEEFATVTSNGIQYKPGYYLNTDGHLSSDKKIQDSLYYQEFSYVLKSGIPLNFYEKTIKNNVHPAGTKLFAIFQYDGVFSETVSTAKMEIGYSNNKEIPIEYTTQLKLDQTDFTSFSETNLAKEMSFLSTEEILDLSGTLKITNYDILSEYWDKRLFEFLNVPISSIIDNKLLIGTDTFFESELRTNRQLIFLNTPHGDSAIRYGISAIHNDTLLTLTNSYPFWGFDNVSAQYVKAPDDFILVEYEQNSI